MIARAIRVALPTCVVLAVCRVPAAAESVPPAPSWSWLFDGGATAHTGWQDGTASGDGVNYDATTPFAYAGNQALRLDGSSDFVEMLSMGGALNGHAQLTISAWIKSDVIHTDRPFLGFVDPANEDSGGVRYDDAGWAGSGLDDIIKFSFGIDGANHGYESGEEQVQTTDWQHVVVVWEDGVGAKLYVDDALDTADYNDFPASGQTSDFPRFLVGTGPKGHTGATWDGRVDELAVWTTALDAGEVSWLNAHSITEIPEPVTLALTGLAAAALGLYNRRRQKRC